MALFRIALGCVTLWVTWQFAYDYSFFFGPPSAHAHLTWALLNVFLPLFSIFLILGFHSRLASLGCCLGITAIQLANTHILYSADQLLRLALFWAIFLPLDSSWSVESWLFKNHAPRLPLSERWGAWAITGQICFVYWFAFLAKTDDLWTQSHDALFFALSIDHLSSPRGMYLLHYPELLRWLTVATLLLESLGPFLLLIPLSTHRDRFRMTTVIVFLSFHLIGMQLFMGIGFFPWICATAWMIFIPSFFWDFLTGPIERHSPKAAPTGWLRLLDRSMAGLILFAFTDILVWNAVSQADLNGKPSASETWMKANDPLQPVLHINQKWHMYAPYPIVNHGWLVVPADLADGSQVDLFTQRQVTWAKPYDIADVIGNSRWRLYIYHLERDQDPEMLRHYRDYLVNRWNREHPESQKVKTMTIVFMKQSTQPDLTITEPTRVTLWTEKY